MTTDAYPLSWPDGWPRTNLRLRARFSAKTREHSETSSWTRSRELSVAESIKRVLGEQGAPWWQVLGVAQEAPPEVVQAAYRALARKHHPDAGGDHGAMAAINRAWEQGKNQ